MLKHRLILPEGILLLEPNEPLEAEDVESVIAEVDPYIAERAKLPGVLIHSQSFLSWADLNAMMAHMQFIESEHEKIGKLAFVSDSVLLAELPELAGHLIDLDVKHFPESAYDDASKWLEESNS
jgi:hypothetical protein